jgi:hypothetical protein
MNAHEQDGEHLTRRQEALLTQLLAHPTIIAAATAAQVPESIARRWLKQPTFLHAYRDARRQQVEQGIAIVQTATSAAVTTLLHNLREDAPPAVQVRAALGILEHAGKAVELLDLVERVEALERMLAEPQRVVGGDVRSHVGGLRRVR